ncbi:MAG: hypothetical protein J5I91_09830 [Bacteroidetes bacterium]|nr:hypothetical protein [Bacteroidota bacterium]
MKLIRISFFITLIAFIISGCDKEKEPKKNEPLPEKTPALRLTFNPKFNGRDLEFNKMKYITTGGDTLNVQRVQMILSNFELIKTNGETVKLDTFAYLNLAENRNQVNIDQEIPEGEYKGIRFMVGLDSAINHGDPMRWGKNHPLNPIVNNMHWGWQGGYIFWVCEGYFMNNGNSNEIFSFHMATLKYLKNIEIQTSNTFSLGNNKKAARDIDVNIDKYFSIPATYSLKLNGAVSHSSSPDEDLRMDVLYGNMDNTFELK